MCLPCRKKDLDPRSCDGRPGKPCSKCGDGECEFPEHDTTLMFQSAADLMTEDGVGDWDRPMPSEERDELMRITRSQQLDPEPETEHFLCIFTARMSSHQGQPAYQNVTAGLVTTQNRYDNLLAGPLLNNVPEGQRPGGPNTPMRSYRQVIARYGARKIPIRVGNVNNPFLINFVLLMQHVTRPNNPNIPMEIHLVNMGLAGFGVDITSYGDRNAGFFKYILDQDVANGTNIAERIYIVTIAEPHLVDGVGNHSLDFPNQSPYWQGHRNKYLVKHRLMDLIDRWAYCVPIWVQNFRNAAWNQANPQAAPLPMQVVQPWLPPMPDSRRMDPFLQHLFHELAWRSGWTDNTTQPTDVEVAARNNGRNFPMQ